MDFAKNEKDGRYYIRPTGSESYEEVTKEVYDRIRAGGAERFGRGFVNSVRDAAGGTTELLGKLEGAMSGGVGTLDAPQDQRTFLERQGNQVRTANDQEQALLSNRSPATNFLGEALPDVALGAAVRRPLQAAALDAGLGAVRNPDNPALGAATSAALGGTAAAVANVPAYIGRLRSTGTERGLSWAREATEEAGRMGANRAARRRTQEAQRAVQEGRLVSDANRAADLPEIAAGRSDSLSAARNVEAAGDLAKPVLGNVIDPQRLAEDYGIPTSNAQALMLATRNPNEFRQARAADKEAFDAWRSQGGAITGIGPLDAALRLGNRAGQSVGVTATPENYGAIRTLQQDGINKAVMSAMGEPNAVAATRQNVGEARRAISDSFNEIAERAGPMDLPADELATVRSDLDALALDDAAERTISRKLDALEKAKDPKTGLIPIDRFLSVKNEIGRMMRQAYKNDASLTVGDALKQVEQYLDYKLYNKLDAEDKADMRANRFKWGVANAALRNTAATNARGDVNIRSFINAYRQGNNRYKIGYDDSEFATFLDTMDAVMHAESRDSGTPAGLAPQLNDIREAVGSMSGLLGGMQ